MTIYNGDELFPGDLQLIKEFIKRKQYILEVDKPRGRNHTKREFGHNSGMGYDVCVFA